MKDPIAQFSRGLTVFSCRALLSLKVEGLPVPSGRPRIYAANHVSHADFVALWSSLPPALRNTTRPVAGSDYWEQSGFRSWMIHKVFRGVLIPRRPPEAQSQPPAGSEEIIAKLAEPLRAGEDLILFPEGTRNLTDTELLPLKSGIANLLRLVPEAEVVPAWISHMERILPKRSFLPVPLNCTLRYGPPLQIGPEETRGAFLGRLRAAMLACRSPQTEAAA